MLKKSKTKLKTKQKKTWRQVKKTTKGSKIYETKRESHFKRDVNSNKIPTSGNKKNLNNLTLNLKELEKEEETQK